MITLTPFKKAVLALTVVTVLFSCKKDKDEDLEGKPLAEAILGVWNVVKEKEVYFPYNNPTVASDSSSTDIPAGIFTLDFRKDGFLYTTIKDPDETERDTVAYQVRSGNILFIDGDEYTVQKLSRQQTIITDLYDDGTQWAQHTLEMKK